MSDSNNKSINIPVWLTAPKGTTAETYELTVRVVVPLVHLDPANWSMMTLLDYLIENPHNLGELQSARLLPTGRAYKASGAELRSRSMKQPRKNYTSSRPRRKRRGSDEQEYCYRSHDYISAASQLRVGSQGTHKGRSCVWITKAEIAQVHDCVVKLQQRRASRRAEKNLQVIKGGE